MLIYVHAVFICDQVSLKIVY